MATPDEVQLQKGALTTAQKEQTGSAKAVSLIESLAALFNVVCPGIVILPPDCC